MTYIKRLIYSFSILFILLVSLLTFFFTTTPGVYTAIKLINLFVPGKIHVHKGGGRLIDHFYGKEVTYDDGNVHVQIIMGSVTWQLKTLLHRQLSAALAVDTLVVTIHDSAHLNLRMPTLPFDLQVNKLVINQVQIVHPSGKHSLNKFELQASLNNKQWIIQSLKTDTDNMQFNVQAHGVATHPYPVEATLHFAPRSQSSHGMQGRITLDGDLALYHWQGLFTGAALGKIQGTLKNGLELQTDANWSGAKWPINRTTNLQVSQGHLAINGTLADYLINATTRINEPVDAEWQITAHVNKKQTDLESHLQFPESHLKTTITAKGTLYDAQHGKLILSINPGAYQLPQGSPIPALQFQGGDLSVNITPEALQAKGIFTIDPHKIVNLALRIPKFHLYDTSSTKQPIDGTLNLQINSLDFLQGLSPAIDAIQGQLQMNLTAKGTLTEPVIKGDISLNNGSLSISKSGLTLSPIDAKLQTSNKHWQAQGSITANGHSLTLTGQGDFSPKVIGQLSLIGDNFPVMKTADYMINLSPQLVMNFNPTSVSITGSVLVPSAQLKPLSFSNTVSLSEDVVFVNKTSTKVIPFNMNTDIQIKMGPEVGLDVKGLHGFLDGAIQIKQSPQSPLSASGELTVRDGKYKAYGQDLIIDQGQLTFASSGAIDNPGIHIRAIRKFSNANPNLADATQSLNFSAANIDTIDVSSQTIVGIELSGHLNAHKIKLFSIPASLSQSDILSMLLLGKPASQASQSGGKLLLAAISSMNLDSGTKGLQLLSQLKQTLGIDINLQNSTGYNQSSDQLGGNTALVVSKSLTKRLYLSYNIGLLQNDNNVLTLKYLLSKFFSIQVTTSDSGSGLDLLYTHGKD